MVFCYVVITGKLLFFIYMQRRLADPCMMFYEVIIYRIIDFILL